MAELQFPNFLAAQAAGYQMGNQMAEQNRALQQRNQLQQLAPQVIGGDPNAYAQAAAIDPEAAQKYDEAGTAPLKKFQGLVTYMDQARASGNPNAIKAALREAGPLITRLTGKPAPTDWTPEMDAGWEQLKAKVAMAGSAGSDQLKSLRIGANGNYWAIQGGQFVDTGVKADPRVQVRDQPGLPPGLIDLRQGTITPLTEGGSAPSPQPAAPQAFMALDGTPVNIDPSLPPNVQAAVRAAEMQGQAMPEVMQAPGLVMPASSGVAAARPLKPDSAPSGYRYLPDGSLAMIPGGPAQIAADARDDAAAAKRAAEEAKAEAKRQESSQRQASAVESASQLVGAIDNLTNSSGFADLGTFMGDVAIGTPMVRSDAKDANAQLKNIAGQVALTTMSRLKALSSQGATGFGALSAPELKLLENSIATLQSEDISNAELRRSLKTIRDSMEKITSWSPGAQEPSAGPLPIQGNNVIPAGSSGSWSIKALD